MSKPDFLVFTVNVDGKDVEIKVRKPTLQDHREAKKVYNRAFKDAIASGCMLAACLDNEMKKQGFWSDQKDMEFKTLAKEIAILEDKLDKGGIKLSEAKTIALEIGDKRNDLMLMLSERNALEAATAESQAENERLNYLVSACLVYNSNGKPYFSSYDEFLNSTSHPVAVQGVDQYLKLMHPIEDKLADLPENKFLKQFGFIDDKYRLVNKQGKLVDRENRLINEDGRFIDENGNFVDKDGNPVDADGNRQIERQPFLDDDGVPLLPA